LDRQLLVLLVILILTLGFGAYFLMPEMELPTINRSKEGAGPGSAPARLVSF
jgi:hypothetical protein